MSAQSPIPGDRRFNNELEPLVVVIKGLIRSMAANIYFIHIFVVDQK